MWVNIIHSSVVGLWCALRPVRVCPENFTRCATCVTCCAKQRFFLNLLYLLDNFRIKRHKKPLEIPLEIKKQTRTEWLNKTGDRGHIALIHYISRYMGYDTI